MKTIEKTLYFFNAEEAVPDDDELVIVICSDDDQHMATFKDGKHRYDKRDRWYVYGPAGAKRRLQKKVRFWAYAPEIKEEDVQF